MKLYVKRIRNSVVVSVSNKKEGPFFVVGGGWVGRHLTPIQISIVHKVVDDERNNPMVEIDENPSVWEEIRRQHYLSDIEIDDSSSIPHYDGKGNEDVSLF